MERIFAEAEHPDPKATARLAKHWELAFKHWTTVVEDDVVWDQVIGRIRELDDPRLTTGVARRLRRTLPILLVTISVRLAIVSARRGDADGAHQHLARASGLDSCRVAAVLDREATPLVDQIKQICERIPERSQADPGHADELAQQLMSDTKPLLSHICAVLDQDHYLRQAAMDTTRRDGARLRSRIWQRNRELAEVLSAIGTGFVIGRVGQPERTDTSRQDNCRRTYAV